MEGGKYNSPEPNGSGIGYGQILRAGHGMTLPDGENPLYFGETTRKTGSGALWGLGPGFALKKLDTNRSEAMTPQTLQAIVPLPRQNRALGVIFLVLACLATSAHALYTQTRVSAFPLPGGVTLKIDGSPDTVWRAISGMNEAINTISFQDYAKMVLLMPDDVRNANPSKYIKNPVNGSIQMLAAYDKSAMYFLFLVKTKTVFNPKTLCAPSLDNLWKADAPTLFLDPSPWTSDPEIYPTYFSGDASGLVYGTSASTVQLAKPINDKDARFYFRNRTRTTSDNFQIPPTMPAGVQAVSRRRSATDTTTVIVEMKIPNWTIGDNNAGYRMFISWGFNMYPDSLWKNCNGSPLAYRWAKNHLNYDEAEEKPPGWRAKDSTHFDPTHSMDGWGELYLSPFNVEPRICRTLDTAIWDMTYWNERCGNPTTRLGEKLSDNRMNSRIGPNRFRYGWERRDIRGRSVKEGSSLLILPWSPIMESGKREPGAELPL